MSKNHNPDAQAHCEAVLKIEKDKQGYAVAVLGLMRDSRCKQGDLKSPLGGKNRDLTDE